MTLPFTAQSVSIIIPCYNAARTLARALNSCLMQTEVAQIIVVDDGSTDSSADIARYYGFKDSRVTLLQTAQNSGPAMARNLGVEHATHSIIAFLDADDEYRPAALTPAVEYLAQNPQQPTIRLKVGFSTFPVEFRNMPDFDRHARIMTGIVTSSLVIRRSVFLELGGFPIDEVFRRYGGEDAALSKAVQDIFGCFQLAGRELVRMHYHEKSHVALYFRRAMGVPTDPEELSQVTAAIDRFVERARHAIANGPNVAQVGKPA